MLRIFQVYRPVQVAKYVKNFFKGRLFIIGIGGFEFEYGRLVPPKSTDIKLLNVLSEVNKEIQILSTTIS
ncbi:hypothetical protein AYY19_12640 [Photobacterium aquimaris]|uniref:DUF1107 domain-containing protein n=1 Tax=Photobacterium aquimaris TaxID=512643 RepID=A0A2T3II05_9GAMM|nr:MULTISPECIES: DUF1107 domain-containing protein [Photobacterium]OBU17731.1 hypothetical protein AYY19_12640 [Photobacterium aquimaris]OBU23178.1 hypothetical protein AYY20_11395 [Photobacterium aquimaris]PSU27974.1 DUF1107 domain-containing protein [Photobacterium aquimaris]PSV99544.1 DUF1107 domain-containing protein [Photobacterium aquimaris]